MFSWPGYISIGDEYDKRGKLDEKLRGRNIMTSPGKRGNLPVACFQKKFLSLSEGDKYIDQNTFDKRYRLEQDKKKLTPAGFRGGGASKTMCGSGTYYGCFCESEPPKHMVEYDVGRPGEAVDKSAKAGTKSHTFVTNPPKKGTYGFPGRTLGEEPKYISDPYEGERRREALAAKEGSKKVVGPPFKAACRSKTCFDETNHGISTVYSLSKALPAKKPPAEQPKPTVTKAWKPAGTLVASITKPPEYQEDPYEAKEKAAREARAKERPTKAWKPIGGTHSLPWKPIKFTPV